MKRFEGKVVLVTGGTKGIGLAVSKMFLDEGAKVIACSRNKNFLDISKIDFQQLDVSDNASCKKVFDYIVEKYGKIDVLVNNAGIMRDRTTAKMSDEEFDSVISTNLKGTFNMTRLVGPYMQKNGYGSIINVSSFVAANGNFGQANYVASKAGIEGMTKCWAKEFAKHHENVRVNCVAPGVVLTDIFKDTPKEIVDGFADKTLLKRLAKPEEIASVITFLASDEASYVTGTVISVDGGISI